MTAPRVAWRACARCVPRAVRASASVCCTAHAARRMLYAAHCMLCVARRTLRAGRCAFHAIAARTAQRQRAKLRERLNAEQTHSSRSSSFSKNGRWCGLDSNGARGEYLHDRRRPTGRPSRTAGLVRRQISPYSPRGRQRAVPALNTGMGSQDRSSGARNIRHANVRRATQDMQHMTC